MTATRHTTAEFLALQRAVAGRFALVRELGRGAMGVVFLARDLALDRLVAIKLLPPAAGAASEARERFLREARTAAGLAHPHIVPIHAVEAQVDLVYFVMGYVEGETLGARLRRDGALPAAEALRIVQEVAWALAHAHANGVVHRDVKPDNVLLDAVSGRAMVADFGIARSADHEASHDGVIRGTPQYVSPEVALGAPGDARSDLYALGALAWMAATGRPPFRAESVAALLLAHVHAPVPPLAGAARVPARFAAAVDRCLAKDPAARWPSAESFAAEIDAARARRPGVPAPVRAFVREWESVGSEIETAATATIVAALEAVGLQLYHLTAPGIGGLSVTILSAILTVIAVLTLGLASARLVQLIAQARGMLRTGFSLRRILAAQAVDDAEREEERQAAQSVDRTQRREMLAVLAGSALGAVPAFALALSETAGWFSVFGVAGAVALPTLAVRTALRLAGDAMRTPLPSRLLRGRIGRWIFRLAGAGLSAHDAAAALEGPEPTALALGEAARDLYLALPGAMRAAIAPDLLDLIGALEQRAMRARGGDGREFTDAVGALEAIRLDLMHLSMKQIEPAAFTAELERVREMGRAVDRQLAAQSEVKALLETQE